MVLILISSYNLLFSQITNADITGDFLVGIKTWNCSDIPNQNGILHIRTAGTTTCLAVKDSSYTTNNTFNSSIIFSVKQVDSTFYGCFDTFLASGKYFSNDSIHLFIRFYASSLNFCAHEYFGKKISTIGIGESKALYGLKLYPNPVSNNLYISPDRYFDKEAEIEITNCLGQTVLKMSYSNTVDVSQLSYGIYNLRITRERRNYYKTFVKE